MSVTAALDSLPISRFHWTIISVIGVVSALNGLIGGSSSFVLAALVKEWQLAPTQVGVVGSMELLGMLTGSVIGGWIADRWGRKRTLIATIILSCIGTALSAFALNYGVYAASRFVVGIGTGGSVPLSTTLLSEFFPIRYRGRLSALSEIFFMSGVIIAALIALVVTPQFGWRAVCLISTVPVLFAYVVNRYILESPRYLLQSGDHIGLERVTLAVEARTGISIPREPNEGAVGLNSTSGGNALRTLFSRDYLRTTACLWVTWFALIYVYYGMVFFLPSLFADRGGGLADSFERVLYISSASLPGCVLVILLVDRIGRKRVLVPFLLLGAAFVYLFGAISSTTAMLVLGSLTFFFTIGCWAVVIGYGPELYPTRLRSTGVGLAMSFGRIGGIIAPTIVGALVGNWGGSYMMAFSTFGLALFAAALAVIFWGRETMGRRLEEITG